MDSQQLELYQRIQAFTLDDLGENLSFSKRLARENGWSAQYTQEAIAQYKKFTFLAVVMSGQATPSEQVDQVWHLHLTYTHSYWHDFCPQVLQLPLHHNPTKGGRIERQKYEDCYKQTLLGYQTFFGIMPPEQFWPSPQVRFGRDLEWLKVNTRSHWVLPKPQLKRKIPIHPRVAAVIMAFALALILTISQPVLGATVSNPLNFYGAEFLWFYAITLSLAASIAYCLRYVLKYLARPQTGNLNQVELNAYEAAYLADGAKRVVETAIASLVGRKHLQPIPQTGSLAVVTPLPSDSHPIETAVARVASSGVPAVQIYSSNLLKMPMDVIRLSLQQQGLVPVKGTMKWVCLLPSLLIAAVLALGLIKIYVGISRGKPVFFLILMCIIAVFILLGFLNQPMRSQFGDLYLARLTSRYTPRSEISFACALFGVTALTGVSFIDLRQVLSPPSNSSSGGDSGGGDDGGGCGGCGGGCGGYGG